MQQSVDLRRCRDSRLSSAKQHNAQPSHISKSLTISQSQGKVLQRYFYRRDGPKIDAIVNLRRSKQQKVGSFHEGQCTNLSAQLRNINKNVNYLSIKNVKMMTNSNDDNVKEGVMQIKSVDQPLQCKITRQFPIEAEGTQLIVYKQQDTCQNSRQSQNTTQMKRKSMRKTSDWIANSNSNHNTNKTSYQATKTKKIQSTQIRLKINNNPRSTKQKYASTTSYTSMDLAIKKHKADNVKQIQQKLRSAMSRGALYDTQKLMSVREYNRKCGYSQDAKVYVWNSEDQHIRRMLQKWGWVQNQSLESPFYHFKWTHMPHFTEGRMTHMQSINHFKNTQEMTAKSSLSKNLRNNQSSFGKIDQYYPKCFDVGNTSQWNNFVQQYRHNVMLILLKRIHTYFHSKQPTRMAELDSFYGYHYKKDPYSCKYYGIGKQKLARKSVFRNRQFRQILLEDYKNRDSNFLVQIRLVIHVLRYWRNFRKQKEEYEDNAYHFLDFDKNKFIDAFLSLHQYSTCTNIGVPSVLSPDFSKEMFSTPSALLLERVCKQYQFCKQIQNLFPTYGLGNVWIVKPISNSRGSGIYLTTDLYEIQQSSKGIQSRLVQKYIQKPLLVKNQKWSALFMRKFDIRQWVLLKSIQPLQIYMFSQCYIRLCHDSYDQSEINELFRHLTNYSINKLRFKNKQDSVLPLTYLKQVMKQEFAIDWDTVMRPQIQQIIIKSIRSCIQNMDDISGNCFELFGYDLLIDEYFKPWLLEVNMSPACEERTPWLSQYLNDMATGLLKIVLPPQLLPQSIDEQQIKYKWQLILKEEACFNRKKDVEQGLQITGFSVQLSNQRKVDAFLLQNKMAIKIQRFFKEYIPLYRKIKQRKSNKINVIQKYLLIVPVYKQYRRKIAQLESVKIQKYLQSICPIVSYRNIAIKTNSRTIEQYLTAFICVRKQKVKTQIYQREVFISLCQTVIRKKQSELFYRTIMIAHTETVKIQQKMRQFLADRKQKRKIFMKYFKTLIQAVKYKSLKGKITKQANIAIIERYLIVPIVHNKHLALEFHQKQKIACQYLTSLLDRKEFITKKLNVFISLVGRVDRVARRRVRCECLSKVLTQWKADKDKFIQNQIELEKARTKQFFLLHSTNLEKILLSDSNRRHGSIRNNKKKE